MRIIARSTLVNFWHEHGDAEQPLKSWFAEAKQAHWKTPAEVKSLYLNASISRNERVVFNIAGNKYRLVVVLKYAFGIIYVRFIGTHEEYDTIDATTI